MAMSSQELSLVIRRLSSYVKNVSCKQTKMENLRIKLNFYKIISYLVDRCNSPAPSRSRQTLEKNVLSWSLAWTGSVVFTCQVSPDTQLPYCACARMRTSSNYGATGARLQMFLLK